MRSLRLQRHLTAIALVVLCGASHSRASDTTAQSTLAAAPFPNQLPLPEYLRQLTDWNGLRSTLERAGLKFTFSHYGGGFANPIGGMKQGLGYNGRFATIVDADLEKLMGWSGAGFHASIQQIQGTQFSAKDLDNMMLVSGVEAPPSMQLFNLWIEQKFGGQINLRFGQFTAAQEFLVSDNANLFVNSTFGWPVFTAQDLPSGGPAFPEATPGARLEFTPNKQLTVRAAVFDGDPAGPGGGSPVDRDPYGVAFRVNDPPLFIAELDYDYGQDQIGSVQENPNQEGENAHPAVRQSSPAGAAGTVTIGAWLHTGSFADERFSAAGGLLAASGGAPQQHWGDYAVYGVLDQALWRLPGGSDRGLNFFLRATAAPSDRNMIDRYADGGFTFKGPTASRPDDTTGISLAFGRVSSQAAAYDRDIIAMTGAAMPVRDFEAVVELTYQWKLANNWFIQPDLQYIVHPGGNIPNPLGPSSTAPIPNAFVFGTQMIMRF
jgi:porin